MFATSKNSFKAQSTMKVLLEVVLLLFVYAQLYPILIEPYLAAQIASSDAVTGAILSLLPFVIAVVILIGIISWNVMAVGVRKR